MKNIYLIVDIEVIHLKWLISVYRIINRFVDLNRLIITDLYFSQLTLIDKYFSRLTLVGQKRLTGYN